MMSSDESADPAARRRGRIHELLDKSDGTSRLLSELPEMFSPEELRTGEVGHNMWAWAARRLLEGARFHEALALYISLHEQLHEIQGTSGHRLHKGPVLIRIADSYAGLGYPLLMKRYQMLALCEDAVELGGAVDATHTGAYFRLIWGSGLPDGKFREYSHVAYKLADATPSEAGYPEWLLQQLDQDWMTEIPAPGEATVYTVNRNYVRHLLKAIGDGTGEALECLAEYLVAAMPGCRVMRRRRSYSTEYDLVCSTVGQVNDFRSELGRYFVCECKDWQVPADFTAFAKFARVLDSIKARFGILVSRQGITGEHKSSDAAREQMKVYQDRGIIIVVFSEEDMRRVSEGESFINMLRCKYETVRLDLRPSGG